MLSGQNTRGDELGKLSRDLTKASKNVIFTLHRVNPDPENRKKVLEQARKALRIIHRDLIAKIAMEIPNPESPDWHRFRFRFTHGLQEYIEASTFYHFLKTNGRLASLQECQAFLDSDWEILQPGDAAATAEAAKEAVDEDDDDDAKMTSQDSKNTPAAGTAKESNPATAAAAGDGNQAETVGQKRSFPFNRRRHGHGRGPPRDIPVPPPPKLPQFPIPLEDYILGVSDIAGEVMRYATNMIGVGDFQAPDIVYRFLVVLNSCLQNLRFSHKDWRVKLNTIDASLQKVERLSYKLHIRRQEYPEGMLQKMLQMNDPDPGEED